MSTRKKVAFHTLGCKLNFTETSTIARSFLENGYELTDFSKKADFMLLIHALLQIMQIKSLKIF